MSRALLVLDGPISITRAQRWVAGAPRGTRVEFKAPRRSLPQNARMWAMLTDVAAQVQHHGIRLSADDWKLLFLDAMKREVRMVPNLDGNGFVSLGRSSSDLSVSEMGDLMELIAAYGAAHGVAMLDQAEPNGLFVPSSADATIVDLIDPKTGQAHTALMEPKVVTVPFQLSGGSVSAPCPASVDPDKVTDAKETSTHQQHG